jgi:predicted secreted protein
MHLLFVTILCAATAITAGGGGVSKTVTLTEKDSGTTVPLSRGDHLVVRLAVSMGTGYSWHLEKEEAEILPFEDASQRERPPESKPGEPEIQVFRFIAKEKGSTSLTFNFNRPWDKATRPLKVFSVAVRIT